MFLRQDPDTISSASSPHNKLPWNPSQYLVQFCSCDHVKQHRSHRDSTKNWGDTITYTELNNVICLKKLHTGPLLQNQIMIDIICTSLQNIRVDLKKAFFQQNCSTITTVLQVLSSTFMVLFSHINFLDILVTHKLFSLCNWAHSQFLGISYYIICGSAKSLWTVYMKC